MKSLHIYIIRCTLLVAMLFAVSWASIKAQTQVATPTFAWNGEQLTMATETEGADIYYSMSRYSAEPTGDGSETNPFNVAAAIAKCREIGETASGETYYVKGVVSQITEPYSVQYGNGTFHISDNGNDQNYFTAYRVLYIGNQKYTEGQQQIQVGDDVVVCGSLVNYKDNTPETAQNTGYLVSMTTPELTTKYESPITVSGNVVIRAKAVKQGLDDSNIAMTSTGIAAYAALNDDNTVLTYYYDDQKNTRNGMDIGPFTLYFNNADNTHSVTGRPWESNASTITTVIFDESLANYTQLTNMVAWFTDFTKLTTIQGLNYLNTEKVTDMSGLFWGCSSLRTLDLSTFNTSNVTSMWSMFDDCTSLTSLNISTFKTSKVTDMRGMFYGCSSLTTLNLSHFDTSNVVYFNSMFRNCSNLTSVNVGSFNTGNAEVIQVMFGYCPKLTTLNLSSFNTTKVTNMVSLFGGCTSLETIIVGSGWVVNNTGTGGTTTDIGENMFYGCTSLKGGKGTVYDDTHTGSEYARIDNAPDAPGYFTDKNAPAANPEPYAVLSENNTVLTFYYDDQMNTRGGMNIADRGWSQDAASITKVQFDSTFVNYYPTSTNEWFSKCLNLTSIVDMKYLKLDRTTDMSGMFLACTSLTSLDVSGFNTQQVTNMQDMFRACTNLTSLDLSKFNTQNVTEMYGMFYNCTNLKSLDLSNFDTRNVRNMDHLFRFCTNLVNLNISGFSTANGASQRNMFEGCSSLASIQAGNAVIADSTYAQIGNPNLLLYVNEASQAPQSVKNVVVLDAAEQIVLTDMAQGNNNFYCPKQFTAKSISYTRNFKQTTQVGVSRGWETIALPFAVQTITHEKNGTLTPFGVEGGKPFWLKELTENGLVSARHMDANVPYLISMPNNSIYPDDYNQAGNVTFSATNVVVPVTESRETSGNNRTLIPTMMSVAQSPDIYVINRDTTYQNNPQGSIFVADYREVRPFEAYVKHVGGARYFSLSEIPQLDVTGLESIELQPWKGEQWWTLDGRKLNRRPSKKGIYIRNGKKVVVDATF